MQTPYGAECKYYYADFYRGREHQVCRLVEETASEDDWTPGLCKDCPAPGIQRANACKHLNLQGKISKRFLGLSRKMEISAYCSKSKDFVSEPYVGCGQCHGDNPIFDNFLKKL